MLHHLSLMTVTVALSSVIVGCDAYQREANLSVSEKPTLEADESKAVSSKVLVSSDNQVSFDNREVDTNALRTEIRRLSNSNMDCVVVLKAHPNARTGTIIETRDLISEFGCSPKIELLPRDKPTSD